MRTVGCVRLCVPVSCRCQPNRFLPGLFKIRGLPFSQICGAHRLAVAACHASPSLCTVRVVHLSDTHGLHDACAVPEGDILIHTGDFCYRSGCQDDYGSFDRFLAKQPHPHKLVVLGNHDLRAWEDVAPALPSATHIFWKEEIQVRGSPVDPTRPSPACLAA